METSVEPSCELLRISLCFILLCVFSPCSDAASKSQRAQRGRFSFSGEGSKAPVEVGELCCFLALNSSLRLAFLLSVEGLGFFLVLGALLLVVSKEKEKVGPTEREKLKTWPWLASAWQNSMHLEARVELTSTTAAILALLLN